MAPTLSKFEKQFEFYDKEHSGKLGQKLNRAREENRFCDFLIKVGSKELNVHKVVIAEVSEYFRGMLDHKMKGSDSGVAEIHDVDEDCMCICIEYIYTGKASCPGSKIAQLLVVADMLQLANLCAAIGNFLQSNLDANTLFATREIASIHSLRDLVKSCDEYAKANFAAIAGKEDFKNLEGDVVLNLIESKETKASEVEKCKSLVLWGNSDPDNRSQTFEDAFLKLKFNEIPKSYKLHLSENESLVSESARCLRQLFKSAMGGDSPKEVEANRVIGFINRKSKMLETFNPKEKSWNVLHRVKDEICEKWFWAIAVEQVVFVLAGDCSNYKFNLSKPTDGWTALPNRSEKGYIQVVELDGEVYAFHNQSRESATIEILNTDHSSWRRIKKSKPCYEEAICATKGLIYSFGGYDGSILRRSVKFDPSTNSWMNLPDMPTARAEAAATSLDDKIYVLGGWNGGSLKTTESFDISTQSWTTLKPMNNQHHYFKAFAFDGKVYAVDSHDKQLVIEEYDPATDTWKDLVKVPDKGIPYKATFTVCT